MIEVGQSTSPLFFQEREVSSNPFGFFGFRLPEVVASKHHQVSADLWGTRKLERGNESISSVEGALSRGRRDRVLESVQTLSEWRNLHAYLEQKAELAVQGRMCGSEKTI